VSARLRSHFRDICPTAPALTLITLVVRCMVHEHSAVPPPAGNFEEALPEEDVAEEPAEQSVDQSEERELAMLVAEVQSEEAQS